MGKGVNVVELYGVGKRYDIGVTGGHRVSVVARRDGKHELYVFDKGNEEPLAVVALDEEEAKLLAAVLTGTYFHAR
ncbi:hypothetical protein [Georgenia alba]|uniref:Potassium/proton antiporter subunit KhtT-like N-terminal domain-containing protein n=1 Tax=Georgenia alba TaxID=2233858 RepID=A0ABW2QD02_9MICO